MAHRTLAVAVVLVHSAAMVAAIDLDPALDATFKHFDANGDGEISSSEVRCPQHRTAIGSSQIDHARVRRRVQYKKLAKFIRNKNANVDVRSEFKEMDADSSGKISRAEFGFHVRKVRGAKRPSREGARRRGARDRGGSLRLHPLDAPYCNHRAGSGGGSQERSPRPDRRRDTLE